MDFGVRKLQHAEGAECFLHETLEECQCMCKSLPECWAIDWNHSDKPYLDCRCWLHLGEPTNIESHKKTDQYYKKDYVYVTKAPPPCKEPAEPKAPPATPAPAPATPAPAPATPAPAPVTTATPAPAKTTFAPAPTTQAPPPGTPGTAKTTFAPAPTTKAPPPGTPGTAKTTF